MPGTWGSLHLNGLEVQGPKLRMRPVFKEAGAVGQRFFDGSSFHQFVVVVVIFLPLDSLLTWGFGKMSNDFLDANLFVGGFSKAFA